MQSFVYLPVFIILVYVSGSTTTITITTAASPTTTTTTVITSALATNSDIHINSSSLELLLFKKSGKTFIKPKTALATGIITTSSPIPANLSLLTKIKSTQGLLVASLVGTSTFSTITVPTSSLLSASPAPPPLSSQQLQLMPSPFSPIILSKTISKSLVTKSTPIEVNSPAPPLPSPSPVGGSISNSTNSSVNLSTVAIDSKVSGSGSGDGTSTSASGGEYLNITSQAGTHAYLPCNVKQLVNKPVSWIRVRDGHILTVDQTTFIADQRFQSIYTQNPERWSLQIKYVQTRDAGSYECQVSTEPKMSARISLNIVEPKTEFLGELNRHVKAGSRVILRCVVSGALEPPLFINWYFDKKQIFLHNQNGWKTDIDRETLTNNSSNSSDGNHSDKQKTIASLIIPSVTKKDSGNYTCSPSNSESITVVLHVLNGEYSASAITSGCSEIPVLLQQGLVPLLIVCLQVFIKI